MSKNQRAEEINKKFLAVVQSRSGGGILGLGRNFRIIDVDRSGQLSLGEFQTALNKFRVGLTEEEAEILFKHYDRDNSGALKFDEFLGGLREKMSPQRRALVEQAFNAFDTDGSGQITFEDLREKYDTSKNPKVRTGEWTPKQAIDEFLKVFEGGSGDRDGTVTKQEWFDYHAGLSSNIDHDDEFGILMSHSWGIEFIPKAEIDKILAIMREKATQKAADKNPKRVAVEMFKHFDTNNTKTIDFKEFCKAMESFSSGLNEKALKTLFGTFDHDGSGEIEYQELVSLVFEGK